MASMAQISAHDKLFVSLKSPLTLTTLCVASGFLIHRLANHTFFNTIGGVSSTLLSFFSPKAKEESLPLPPLEWDPHGLSDNVELDLNELSEIKKYKVSNLTLIDNLTCKSIDADDPLNRVCALEPGAIYTKSQLQEKLENLLAEWGGFFKTLCVICKTNRDGTIGIIIYFVEFCWSALDRIKYINVGLMDDLECTTCEKEPQETSLKKYRREDCGYAYKSRIDMSRPCMLPASTQGEILDMVVLERQVTPRLLLKIGDKVTGWYQDNGYPGAQVVNVWNLDTRELVCEVVEGIITEVVVQFQDKLGNAVCEEKPQYGDVRKEFSKYLSQGKVYKTEEANQAMQNVKALELFSKIEIRPTSDVKNEGGILIQILLTEMAQQPA